MCPPTQPYFAAFPTMFKRRSCSSLLLLVEYRCIQRWRRVRDEIVAARHDARYSFWSTDLGSPPIKTRTGAHIEASLSGILQAIDGRVTFNGYHLRVRHRLVNDKRLQYNGVAATYTVPNYTTVTLEIRAVLFGYLIPQSKNRF